VLLIGVLFAVVVPVTRGRALRWTSDPVRAAVVSAARLIALGVFKVVYWDVRVPAIFGFGWFPTVPYNRFSACSSAFYYLYSGHLRNTLIRASTLDHGLIR
jgi:hypothetical protein